MISINKNGVYLHNGKIIPGSDASALGLPAPEIAKKNTISYSVLQNHNVSGNMDKLSLRFDALASHDITYVGIIQTCRASGLTEFPVPYVLTNCHNSLCAVGGTINEDDHIFGLSAAKRYGGEFVPAHQAVIHQYMRERYATSGNMILASDSHTRYGAYGTLSIGEGGPELVKQILKKTYDVDYPDIVCVYLTGKPRPGVGPQDIALALIGATFDDGTVKNKILEFVGPGIASLSMDYRNGIDVMTTETACLSSIWQTDDVVKTSLTVHGRPDAYKELAPGSTAYYDSLIVMDLSKAEPMIALPFHPSNAYTIADFKANMTDILREVDKTAMENLGLKSQPESLLSKVRDGKFYVDQGVIAGCSGGTFQNIMRASEILAGHSAGNGPFALSVYPASQPIMLELMNNGALSSLLLAGASLRSAFCGPCFGAGDVPGNGGFSIRHSTRNFPNREGSKPSDNQAAYVALMDARSIAATALNGGVLTSAFELENIPEDNVDTDYHYNSAPYDSRVYFGVGKTNPDEQLVFGPNITDWPQQIALPEDLLLTFASAIYDPVTTTDELIPSGETSSYRSNPLRLSEYALSRKDPQYVGRAKAIQALEKKRQADPNDPEVKAALGKYDSAKTGLGSIIMALRPGDGSAREQAASCQRVLGGVANLASEYATKRYKSNVINWGMLPFTADDVAEWNIAPDDKLYIPGIRTAVEQGLEQIDAVLIKDGKETPVTLALTGLTAEEREIILAGCLINFYAK